MPRTPPPARARQDRETARRFQQAGDPVRLLLLLMLRDAGELPLGEMAGRLAMNRPAVGHHLAVLRLGRLATSRRERGRAVYRLTAAGQRLAEAVGGLVG